MKDQNLLGCRKRFNGNYLAKKNNFYERYYEEYPEPNQQPLPLLHFEKNAKQRFDRIQNVRNSREYFRK